MKHKIFTLLLSFASFSGIYAQNYDFETWTEKNVLLPFGYQTSLSDNYENNSDANITQSTDAVEGDYSIKLETIEGNDGPLPAVIFNGDPFEFTGGHPVALNSIDSLTGYYKNNMVEGDTAIIICFTKFNGSVTSGNFFKLQGTHEDWTRFAFPVNAAAVDTAIFAIISSNLFDFESVTAGSVIQFDNLKYKSNTEGLEALVNYSFETWETSTWEDPNNWQTPNARALGSNLTIVSKTTNAYSGNFACEISTVTDMYGDTIYGRLQNGDWGMNGGIIGGQPFSENPESIRFWYKYETESSDYANFSFHFKKEGEVIEQVYYQINENASEFTMLEIEIYNDILPDTVFTSIWAGNNPGTKLTIDKIEMVVSVGENELQQIKQIVAYPNPAKDVLKFEINSKEDIKISIYNINGQEVLNTQLNGSTSSNTQTIDISSLTQGKYIYKIHTAESVYTKAFVKL
jgi:hypothetical protein